MTTQTMRDFIAKNSQCKIICGERLTPEGKTLYTVEEFKRSDRVKYDFEDGTSMVLLRYDLKSAPDFKPEWDLS